jgi:hypothetical protein
MKKSYLNRGRSRAVLRTIALAFGLAILGTVGALGATPTDRATAGVQPPASAYYWPIKPFDQPHPVRANFGDPRTVFHGPPTAYTLYHGTGSFTFHRGIDIAAPAGTKVYPVRDGVVIFDSASHVNVRSADGTVFEYWHIGATLPLGTVVHAGKTVLGTIKPTLEHVDLTEVQNGHVTNPLTPGHLTPYSDPTRPAVASIRLQSDDFGHVLLPNFVRGSIWLVAAAYDMPSLAVTGNWTKLPVTPALITWRIQSTNGIVVVPTRVAADFRTSEPRDREFWSTYARGTFQNMATFATHYSLKQPGKYLFLLSPTKFDTHSLHDGIYDLVVTATDIRGHSSSRSLRFTIHNRPGWIGS